jgi:hypothetical protein
MPITIQLPNSSTNDGSWASARNSWRAGPGIARLDADDFHLGRVAGAAND